MGKCLSNIQAKHLLAPEIPAWLECRASDAIDVGLTQITRAIRYSTLSELEPSA